MSKVVNLKEKVQDCDKYVNMQILHSIIDNMLAVHQYIPLLDLGTAVYVCLYFLAPQDHSSEEQQRNQYHNVLTNAQPNQYEHPLFQSTTALPPTMSMLKDQNICDKQPNKYSTFSRKNTSSELTSEENNSASVMIGIGELKEAEWCFHGCLQLQQLKQKLTNLIPSLHAMAEGILIQEFYGSVSSVDPEYLVKSLLAIASRGDVVAAFGVGKLSATPIGGSGMVLRLSGEVPQKIKAAVDRPGLQRPKALCLITEESFKFIKKSKCKWLAYSETFLEIRE